MKRPSISAIYTRVLHVKTDTDPSHKHITHWQEHNQREDEDIIFNLVGERERGKVYLVVISPGLDWENLREELMENDQGLRQFWANEKGKKPLVVRLSLAPIYA